MLWLSRKKDLRYRASNVYVATPQGDHWVVRKQRLDGTWEVLKDFTYKRKNEALTRVGTLYQTNVEHKMELHDRIALDLDGLDKIT